MSEININKFETNNPAAALAVLEKSQGASKSPGQGSGDKVDPLLLAYMEIFQSVQLSHKTAEIQAKSIAINAQQQEKMINIEAGINFQTLRWSQMFTHKNGLSVRKTVLQTDIEKLQTHNQEISAIRGVIADQITVLRQNAQMNETNLNSVVNESQQSVQQGGSLMQMLVSLTNQISRI